MSSPHASLSSSQQPQASSSSAVPMAAPAPIPAETYRGRFINPGHEPASAGNGRKKIVPKPKAWELNPEEDFSPKGDLRVCMWNGAGCGYVAALQHMWTHVAMSPAHREDHKPATEGRAKGKVRCLWQDCGLLLAKGSMKKHIQVKHLGLRRRCKHCGNEERQDSYLTYHGLARKHCDKRPTNPPIPSVPPPSTIPRASGRHAPYPAAVLRVPSPPVMHISRHGRARRAERQPAIPSAMQRPSAVVQATPDQDFRVSLSHPLPPMAPPTGPSSLPAGPYLPYWQVSVPAARYGDASMPGILPAAASGALTMGSWPWQEQQLVALAPVPAPQITEDPLAWEEMFPNPALLWQEQQLVAPAPAPAPPITEDPLSWETMFLNTAPVTDLPAASSENEYEAFLKELVTPFVFE